MILTSNASPRGILLNLQMLCDELDDRFWHYTSRLTNDSTDYAGCRVFYPGCPLEEHIVYILPENHQDHFPIDQYPYVSQTNLEGKAPHICVYGRLIEEIADQIISTFQRYRQFESSMNEVITGDGSLNDLCIIGSQFFRNPLYIHDNMFSVIAIPQQVEGMLNFDTNADTGEMHIPLWLINDFKFDEAYQQTLLRHSAGIWGTDQYPHNIRSLYVNLWEGDYYYGRLLINEIESSLKPGQFHLAEIFAEYCKLIIRRDIRRSQTSYASHEETLHALLTGQSVHDSDLKAMMETLSWQKGHSFLCLKIISQDSRISVRSDSALRSVLSVLFKGSVLFFHEQCLCVLLNLTQLNTTPGDVVILLAPLIRDSYVYGGLSNPVTLGPDIHTGFLQADVALAYIQRKKTMQWLVNFSECTMDYLLEQFDSSIPRKMLISPLLYQLRNHDHEKGTQYYDTLKTFILCERSIPKTASALFVHRTTLLYRLEKIDEILHMNLDDPDIRLHLMISFHFMETDHEPEYGRRN